MPAEETAMLLSRHWLGGLKNVQRMRQEEQPVKRNSRRFCMWKVSLCKVSTGHAKHCCMGWTHNATFSSHLSELLMGSMKQRLLRTALKGQNVGGPFQASVLLPARAAVVLGRQTKLA
jgi:hypothetical protein